MAHLLPYVFFLYLSVSFIVVCQSLPQDYEPAPPQPVLPNLIASFEAERKPIEDATAKGGLSSTPAREPQELHNDSQVSSESQAKSPQRTPQPSPTSVVVGAYGPDVDPMIRYFTDPEEAKEYYGSSDAGQEPSPEDKAQEANTEPAAPESSEGVKPAEPEARPRVCLCWRCVSCRAI